MEQDLLDQHDEEMSVLAAQIKHIFTNCSRSSNFASCKLVFRKLISLQTNLSTVSTEVSLLSEETTDFCHLHQYQEQIDDLKKERGDLRNNFFSLDPQYASELQPSLTSVEKGFFECSLQIKK